MRTGLSEESIFNFLMVNGRSVAFESCFFCGIDGEHGEEETSTDRGLATCLANIIILRLFIVIVFVIAGVLALSHEYTEGFRV